MDKSVKIIVAVVVVAVIGYFVFNKMMSWYRGKLATAVQEEQEVWRQKTDELEKKITDLQEELTVVKGQNVPEDKLAEVFGEEEEEGEDQKKSEDADGLKQTDASDIERQIKSFFTYLDNQPYVQAYELKGGSYLQYQIAVEKLTVNPPIITGEMDSLYNMVRNVAHFYRSLGKKRVLLTKQVLNHESEVIESVMKTFYLWFILDAKGAATIKGRPSLDVLYVYSGYLLNTLGGRSYLLRRDPKVRILTTYYCVLILDKANDANLNSMGIDIRPYINSSLNEIKNQIGLVHQAEYVAKLDELRRKYPQKNSSL
ncbi:MAG: hypothetical protein PVJ56_03255 [Desulfobacterales bacterium]|jgi:hypothetical protein